MSVVRRGARRAGTVAGLVLAGLLVGAPAALAQEVPVSDTGTVVVEPDPCAPGPDGSVPEMCQGGAAPEPDPCPPQPVEPGDGVLVDPPAGDGPDGGSARRPMDRDQPVSSEQGPGRSGPDDLVCAFGAPVADAGAESGDGTTTGTGGAVRAVAATLPRTGLSPGLVVLAGLGAALLVVGGFTLAAGRKPLG